MWGGGGTKLAWSGGFAVLLVAFSLAGCGTVLGWPYPRTGSVVLSWRRPTLTANGTRLTELAGYDLFGGLNPSALRLIARIPSKRLTHCRITGLSGGTWYFVITSYTTDGTQSVPSHLATKVIRGNPALAGRAWGALRWRCWPAVPARRRKG